MDIGPKTTFSSKNQLIEKVTAIKDYEFKFLLHTEGSHSVRYNSICFTDNDSLIYPCGIYLNKLSIKENKILKTIYIDNSIIYNVQKKDNFVIAVCYNGKGALIDLNDFSIAKKFQFDNANTVSNVSFSDDLSTILISAEYYDDEVSEKTPNSAACGVLVRNEFDSEYYLVQVIKRNECLVELNSDNDLVVIEKVYATDVLEDSSDKVQNSLVKDFNYKFSLINMSLFLRKNKEYIDYNNYNNAKENNNTYIRDDILKKPNLRDYSVIEKLFEKNEEISFVMKSEKRNYIGISFYRRNILFLDLNSLKTLLLVEFEGKGLLGGMDLQSNKLYLSNKSETIISMDLEKFLANNLNNEMIDKKINKQSEKNSENLIVKLKTEIKLNDEKLDSQISRTYLSQEIILNNPLIHSLNYCLRVSPNGKTVCWVNESGLHVYSCLGSSEAFCFTRNSPIKMTGVGLSISKVGGYKLIL